MPTKSASEVVLDGLIKDMIKDYIMNNLRVRITKERGGYGSVSNCVLLNVQLELEGIVISESYDYINEADAN
ncbi:hypothetical protein E4H12_01925 [Candidatus Thorarchaeota archaeon]|nr:MAG: hypothetical protein E4H12_01925 [Candidatus Thorarchaeota archaeon]